MQEHLISYIYMQADIKKVIMLRKFILLSLVFSLFLLSIKTYSQDKGILPTKVDVTVKQDEIPKEKNTLAIVRDWLIPVSTFITLLTVAIGAYQSLREYRLKLRAESRLTTSTAVEMDIKLMQGFTDLLALAHSRKGSYLSEKTVEKMFDNKLFTDQELKDPQLLNRKLEAVAVLNVFSGIAEQDAFIAAITNLGIKHEILRSPTIQALETMQSFKPELAKKYLDILKDRTSTNVN